MNLNHHYWNINKQFVLDVLKFELGSYVTISDSTYKNDECPSFEIQFHESKKVGKLYLPSHYRGEYNDYVLYEIIGDTDIQRYFSTNLGRMIDFLQNFDC
jgi:hypothetical protein